MNSIHFIFNVNHLARGVELAWRVKKLSILLFAGLNYNCSYAGNLNRIITVLDYINCKRVQN